MTTTAKIPTRYTRANDHDQTTIASGIPGVTGWVWTVHTKHTVRHQGVAPTCREARQAADAAELAS